MKRSSNNATGINRKADCLREFILRHEDLPQQGTDEWRKRRKDFIGGSEVATILRQNKYKTISKLVLEKLGFGGFKGNVITHWGNVFEDLIRRRCEETFSCKIYETSSIPYAQGSLSYSPDGLSVVPTALLKREIGRLPEGLRADAPDQLVLFEFKCPHSRAPSYEIPPHYLPQVSIGMNIIDIMETALFVQATYRRCAFTQLAHDTRHNPTGHFKPADVSAPPVECGMIAIYTDQMDAYSEDVVTALMEVGDASLVHVSAGTTVADIGTLGEPALLEEILGNCVSGTYSAECIFWHTYDPAVFKRDAYTRGMYDASLQFQAMRALRKKTQEQGGNNNREIVCIMPYKLLNVFTTPVSKNPRYIEETKAYDTAVEVLKCVNDHQGIDDKTAVSKSVRKRVAKVQAA